MGIDLLVGGKRYWNASDYSVAEDAIPVDPSDSSGAVGQFTVTFPLDDYLRSSKGSVVELVDGNRGSTQGVVSSVTENGQTVTLTCDSRMIALTATRSAAPYIGTLEGAFRYYVGLVGVTASIVVDSAISTIPVTLKGWTGPVWDRVKALCIANEVEVALVADRIYLRQRRGNTAVMNQVVSRTWTQDASQLAQSVEIYAYKTTSTGSGLAYPLGSAQTLDSLPPSSRLVFNISLTPSPDGVGASLTSVMQPVCVDTIPAGSPSASLYKVVNDSGVAVPAATWIAGGGNVRADLSADGNTLTITVTTPVGLNGTNSFSLSGTDSLGNKYSTLQILGTGIFYTKTLHTFSTGVDATVTADVVGVTVDTPEIDSYEKAFRLSISTAGGYSSGKLTLSIEAPDFLRKGGDSTYGFMTMGLANTQSQFAGMTMGQVNTEFAGMTRKAVSAVMEQVVAYDFQNQAFGNTAGARVYDANNIYRITSVTALTPTTVQIDARNDVVFADANKAFAGMTMGQVNAVRAGETNGSVNVQPLRSS